MKILFDEEEADLYESSPYRLLFTMLHFIMIGVVVVYLSSLVEKNSFSITFALLIISLFVMIGYTYFVNINL